MTGEEMKIFLFYIKKMSLFQQIFLYIFMSSTVFVPALFVHCLVQGTCISKLPGFDHPTEPSARFNFVQSRKTAPFEIFPNCTFDNFCKH